MSVNTRKEIDHAAITGKRIIPIYYRAVPDDEIPEPVAKFQRIDFTNSTSFDSDFAKLTLALDTDLDWKQTHTRLLTRAKEWEQNGNDGSFLLRGKDLSEAEQWISMSSEKEPRPTVLHSQYILVSRQSVTNRQWTIIGAVVVALLVTLSLAIYAFHQRNNAESEAREAQRQKILADANAAEDTKQKETAIESANEASRQKRIAIRNEIEAKRQQGIAETRPRPPTATLEKPVPERFPLFRPNCSAEIRKRAFFSVCMLSMLRSGLANRRYLRLRQFCTNRSCHLRYAKLSGVILASCTAWPGAPTACAWQRREKIGRQRT